MALALFDDRLDEDTKEPVDVRLANEQVERQLHRVALYASRTFCAALVARGLRQ
jgi:hypothetical protein